MKGSVHPEVGGSSMRRFARSVSIGFFSLSLAVLFSGITGCASRPGMQDSARSDAGAPPSGANSDPRVGLGAGVFDAEEAAWNLRVLSSTRPPDAFVGVMNSDLAFKDHYAIQGNYNGIQIWDISDPRHPSLVKGYVCPASQSDVSVYGNLLFVSGEGLEGRLDCGTEGVPERVSSERLRGIRIFDISDIRNPEYVSNVQTCRGSHTHSVLKDPQDDENVYIYVSGSAGVRPEEELPGCSAMVPDEDPNSALFRIEIIKVPLAHPEQAAIVSSPRIFEGLVAPVEHGEIPGEFSSAESRRGDAPRPGPDQCHDITLYPAIGMAGGACEGYGLLLDITDPVNPIRMDAVADSNFSYWHSATFNNDGTKILFSDEWGGGGQAKCRVSDPYEWGADAIFTLENGKMKFNSYYKLPAYQTSVENCVAHNGSMIPIPGRDVMVQAWYQGGISVIDWTDPMNPVEIAFHDRGPVSADELVMGGSWSVYWFNGVLVSSEIARGLDIFELTPSEWLSENEIAAANTVTMDILNTQGQPKFEWPASFALARAYVDQIERSSSLSESRIADTRRALASAEAASGSTRRTTLRTLQAALGTYAQSAGDPAKVLMLANVLQEMAL